MRLPAIPNARWVRNPEENRMPEWLTLVLVLAAYLVIMKWVLPRFGVAT